MEIRAAAGGSSESIVLPLAPFRRIVKDYFLVCESYYEAIRDKTLTQVEAIDVGRRSLHDEGSALLTERLAGKVAIDHDTARRLFTADLRAAPAQLSPPCRSWCSPRPLRAGSNCCARSGSRRIMSNRPISTRHRAAVNCRPAMS